MIDRRSIRKGEDNFGAVIARQAILAIGSRVVAAISRLIFHR